MNGSLQGKVAVITGGGEGIGLASAKRLSAEGAAVFIVGRRQAILDAAVADTGGDVVALQADVSKPVDLDRVYEAVRASKGKIDILVANAGVQTREALGSITEEGIDYQLAINFKGVIFTVQQAIATTQSGTPYSWNVSGGAAGGLAAKLNGSNGANYVNLLGRDSRMQPGIKDVDVRGSRSVSLTQKLKLQFELESFNIFNHRNITGVNTMAYTVTGTSLTYQSSFGVLNAAGNTVYRERQIQGDLRRSF